MSPRWSDRRWGGDPFDRDLFDPLYLDRRIPVGLISLTLADRHREMIAVERQY
jgi:hypothetical protein